MANEQITLDKLPQAVLSHRTDGTTGNGGGITTADCFVFRKHRLIEIDEACKSHERQSLLFTRLRVKDQFQPIKGKNHTSL